MYFSGDNIVKLRKKLKLTQQEFADKIGYSRTYLSDIEVGKVDPSRRFLESISKQLGVPLSSLATSGLEDWLNYTLSTNESEYFVFLYGFSESELLAGEEDLLLYLKGFNYVVVDATAVASTEALEEEVMRLAAGSLFKHEEEGKCADYVQFAEESEYFIIFLKNLSKSRIPAKGMALLDLIKKSKTQTIIVLDKPSFLENHYDELYLLAVINPVSIDN